VTAPDEEARRRAIEDAESNLLVEAGAGSGKTTVLTDRLERILLGPGADLSRIVAITFTDKAAGELKSRLRDLCLRRYARAVEEGDETAQQRWGRHRRDLEGAHIGTIHSFCARLLRVHALRVGLDPQFTVLDDTEATLCLRACVQAHVLQHLRAGDKDVRVAVAGLGLGDLVGALVYAIRSRSKLDLSRLPRSPEEVRARWHDAFAADAGRDLGRLREDSKVLDAAEVLRTIEPLDPTDKLAELRSQLLPLLETVLSSDSPARETAEAWAALRRLSARTNVGKQAGWPGEVLDRVKAAMRVLRERADTIGHLASPGESLEVSAAELTARFCRALPGVLESYRAAKREAGALDFDDLLLLARDLLRDFPDVRDAEQQRFEHVLVDEFQDTDPVQRELIWFLAEEGARAASLAQVALRAGRLFLVGDAKQSIYAFRGADVTVYEATRREFRDAPLCDTVPLSANFRSQPGLVAFYNELFSRESVMGGTREGRQPYEAYYEPLSATRPRRGGEPDLTLIVAYPNAAKMGDPRENAGHALQNGVRIGDLREIAADALARYLAEAVREGRSTVVDRESGELRGARWGDIMVLFPTMTSILTYERALRAHEVPYYVVAGKGFYHRPEVLDLVTVLRVIDDPQDEIALARVLRSPMFCVSDEGIYWLGREGGLARGVRGLRDGADLAPPAHLSPEDREAAMRAVRALDRLRGVNDRLPVSELVLHILEETSLLAIVAAQFDGQRAYANLQKLVEVARGFETQGSQALARFTEYVETLRTQEMREGEAPAEEERGSAVTLMTIHKAKGLQAPVIVAADLARGGERTAARHMVLHPEVGPIVKGEAENGERRFPPLGEARLRDLRDRETAEEKRLLYVALTRAEDRLIICTPIVLGKDGLPTPGRNGEHIRALWSAFGEKLLHGDHLSGTGEFGEWEAEVTQATERPSDVPSLRGSRSWLATHRDLVEAAQPIPPFDAGAEAVLLRRIQPIEPDLAARSRFTVTELTWYLRCPRCYELRYVRGLAEHRPPGERAGAGGLTPQERGILTHRALQRLGRGPAGNLAAVVEDAARELGLAGHDPAELPPIAEMLARFIKSGTWQLVSAAADLRTEATVVARLEGGVLEGQIDALVTDANGRSHLIDYKTGREGDAGTEAEHTFQVGAYAVAFARCRGELPASVTVHYLATDRRLEVPVAEAAREAAQWLAEAMGRIREAQFPHGAECDRAKCAYAWVCEGRPEGR